MAYFPRDIGDNNVPYVLFTPYNMPDQTQRLTNYEQAVKVGAPVGEVVILPVSENIEDDTTHSWNMTESLSKQGGDALIDYGISKTSDYIEKRTGGKISKQNAGGALKAIKNTSGNTLDPEYFYVYQGSNPRSFVYSINMVPQTKNEAKNAIEIVKIFKKYSSPIRGVFVKNYMWKIEPSGSIGDAIKFDKHPWVITNVTSNWTGAGFAGFYEDGNPKQINLSISFAEMSTMYSDDWG